jgi:CheY-like chemotaxis protein
VLGLQVETFSGSAAFAARRHRLGPPDLILADYHLDGENGLDAIAAMRAAFGQDLAAVLITADRSQEVRNAAEAMDVPVINKPLKPAVLRTMMMRARRLAPAAE